MVYDKTIKINSILSKLLPLEITIFHNPACPFMGIFSLSSENIPSLFDIISKDLISNIFQGNQEEIEYEATKFNPLCFLQEMEWNTIGF